MRTAVLACAAALPLAAGVVAATGAGAQPAPGAAPTVVASDSGAQGTGHRARTGAADPRTPLRIAVALTPRDRAGADRYATAVADPHSPLYHHFLTPRQYRDRFAPTDADVAAVRDYLTHAGLTLRGVSANRQVVDVTGTPDTVHAAFGTTVGAYRGFYAADGAVTLPAAVAGRVSFVGGLTNAPLLRPAARQAPAGRALGGGPNGGMTPQELRKAYAMDSVVADQKGGAGRTIGLMEFDGFKQSDITAFTKQFGLPTLKPKIVDVDGGVDKLGDGQGEVTLDIASLTANAPNATQLVYESPNTSDGAIDQYAKVADDNDIDVYSGSWLRGEACGGAEVQSALHDSVDQMVSEGITFISASGDWGGHGCDYAGDAKTATADYPASDPHVTGVGATSLTTTSDGGYASEKVWNDHQPGSTQSGGQYSSVYKTPDFQKQANGKEFRAVADVSMAGDPNAGGIAMMLNGAWTSYGGTSEAAPLLAGFQADVVRKAGDRMGDINATIYDIAQSSSYARAFHDVTQGGNDTYDATSGYDLPTGWGTPVGPGLFAALTQR